MRRAVLIANLLIALVIAGVMTVQLRADRQSELGGAFRDAENLAAALAEHGYQTLTSMELALNTVAGAVATMRERETTLTLDGLLRTRQDMLPMSIGMFVLDAEGGLLASYPDDFRISQDMSELPEFINHANGHCEGMCLGLPRTLQGAGIGERWGVTVTRSVTDPDGGFDGIAGAVLSLDYLLALYDAIRVGEDGVVGLFSRDGIQIARSPLLERAIGLDVSETENFQQIVAAGVPGSFSGPYPTDGVRRIGAYRPLTGGSAVVIVGLGVDEVLAGWYQRRNFQLLIVLAAMLLFMLASYLMVSHASRLREWQEQRAERMRVMAQASQDLVRAETINTLLDHVAESARRLIGAHHASASVVRDGDYSKRVTALSLSDAYARWNDYREPPDGSGIYRLVCGDNQPARMTRDELQQHPVWQTLRRKHGRSPMPSGWLAVPIVNQAGESLGLIQLFDKQQGQFSEYDANEMVQLASVTGVAVDKLLVTAARDEALARVTAAREDVERILSSISDAMYALDEDWRFTYLNAEAERVLGSGAESLIGRVVWDAMPELRDSVVEHEFRRAVKERQPVAFEYEIPSMHAWYNVRAFPHAGRLTVYFQDISARVQAEERLRQSQKMDAIGQLTGGVAHDFNNLLTVIIGSAEVIIERGSELPEDVRDGIDMIRIAGARAAELTHRLLAFARKQPLEPRDVDVNALVADTESILRRTLGENIDIELVRGGGLWKAEVDPNQLQNALLNLALNARDAMPSGGRLTIETANMSVDDAYARDNEIRRGHYVMIAVTDNGDGMPAAVLSRAFEPFYTTKTEGRGSGLGLSMVYGFVRQSGGQVRIYSETGEGTTVKMFLPRGKGIEQSSYRPSAASAVDGGHERILVVEDDPLVRTHVVNSLQSLGYEVTACETGREALAELAANAPPDLLLSDVMLPGGMTGRQVADEALKLYPGLRVLFMSGYTENAIVHQGRLDPGVHLLNKPFRLVDLARKLREVIDAPRDAEPGAGKT